jgi:hypothetical protein
MKAEFHATNVLPVVVTRLSTVDAKTAYSFSPTRLADSYRYN